MLLYVYVSAKMGQASALLPDEIISQVAHLLLADF